MRRRRGSSATIQAAFGVIHGQVFEYCRLAREAACERHRKAALAIKVSLAVFAIAFVLLGVLFLMQVYKGAS
jgi:hypothetical protein